MVTRTAGLPGFHPYNHCRTCTQHFKPLRLESSLTDGSCHNNVQAGLTKGEREQLGTRPKFLNQRHDIIQHRLREVRHAGGQLVDQSPRVLERHNVDLVRIQSVSRHRKNLSYKTAPVLLRIVFSIAALSIHSTKPVLVIRQLAAVVCISGRLSLSLILLLLALNLP